MNLKKFLEELEDTLSAFVVDDQLISELLLLMKESGSEQSFLARLVYCLKILMQFGVMATQHEQFELLADGVFSMRIKSGQYNIRILYMFFPDKSPALLHAFYERAGHARTDYTGKIDLARQRFAELKEEQ